MKNKQHPKRLLIEDGGFSSWNVTINDGYPAHWHDFYEFEWVKSGSCVHRINDRERILKEGDFIFCTTADIHEIVPLNSNENLIFTTAHFDGRFLTETSKKIIYSLKSREFGFDAKTRRAVYSVLSELLDISKKDCSLKTEIIKNRIETLLLYCAEADGDFAKKSYKSGLLNAIGYIDNNFRTHITLSCVAQIAGFSSGAFSAVFHEKMGVTFQEYLVAKRLKWAATLLKSTEYNVTQIAYDSGFNSHSHFSHSFKKKYGISPAEFRRTNEENT